MAISVFSCADLAAGLNADLGALVKANPTTTPGGFLCVTKGKNNEWYVHASKDEITSSVIFSHFKAYLDGIDCWFVLHSQVLTNL